MRIDREILYRNDTFLKKVDYQGLFTYENDTLKQIAHNEGFCSFRSLSEVETHYVLSDHLGNTRVVFNEKQETECIFAYYPYGKLIAEQSFNAINYQNQYQGKEYIKELGYYDFHARYYDAETGRWIAVDPALQCNSPYLAVGNNPIKFTDPDGKFFIADDILIGMAIGAGISALMYTATVATSQGGFNNWDWGQFAKTTAIGAGAGAISAGVGHVFGPTGDLATELGRGITHAVTQGMYAGWTGGDPMSAAMASGFGSLASSGMESLKLPPELSFGGSCLVGGIASEIGGGEFWQGAASAAIGNLANHYMHNGGDYSESDEYEDPTMTWDEFKRSNHIYGEAGVTDASGEIMATYLGGKTLSSIAGFIIDKATIPIYRVFGGDATMYGKSYSLINPKYVPNYRNFAGLPKGNSGEFLLKGKIPLRNITIGKPFATPLHGNTGGLPFELYQNYNQLINPKIIPFK